MDDINIQQQQNPLPQEHTQSYLRKKRVVTTVEIVFLIIVVAVIGYVIWKKYHHGRVVATPTQTLNNLRLTSGPDRKTIAQKSATITSLEKTSKTSSKTSQEQLNMLNSLTQ